MVLNYLEKNLAAPFSPRLPYLQRLARALLALDDD
jgi:hypothetical protein